MNVTAEMQADLYRRVYVERRKRGWTPRPEAVDRAWASVSLDARAELVAMAKLDLECADGEGLGAPWDESAESLAQCMALVLFQDWGRK